MCVAVPAKILSIDRDNNTAEVEFNKNKLAVNISLVSPEVGDFVLVHAGCAIEIISRDMAEEIESLFDEIEKTAIDFAEDFR